MLWNYWNQNTGDIICSLNVWTCSNLQDHRVRKTATVSCFHRLSAETACHLWLRPRIHTTDSLLLYMVISSWNKQSRHCYDYYNSNPTWRSHLKVQGNTGAPEHCRKQAGPLANIISVILRYGAIIIFNAPLMSNEYLHQHLNANATLLKNHVYAGNIINAFASAAAVLSQSDVQLSYWVSRHAANKSAC